MIDLQIPNEWQILDTELGILKPYYTKPFLDELDTWDLSDKKLFEYGLGASTVYWSKKCKEVYGVENNEEYFDAVSNYLDDNGDGSVVLLGYANDKKEYVSEYISLNAPYDIIIVDGEPVEWRDDCIKTAIKCLNKNGYLIIDNYLQKSVWVASEEVQQLLSKYHSQNFRQHDHPDWQTSIFLIE
jgi:predicted O-methyltransferase YrrM